MNISSLKFNFNILKNNDSNKVTYPLSYKNNQQKDTFTFKGNTENSCSNDFANEIMQLLYNNDELNKLVPKHKGVIYKKVKDEKGNVIKKIPVEVDITKPKSDEFHFIKDGKKLGSVKLSYISDEKCKEESSDCTYKNYEEEGIVGDRIVVDYVRNFDEDEYGGIAHLADLIEVAACKELGFKPNVVSLSLEEAAPTHYVRGKRFVPFEKYCRKLMDIYGKEPNDIVGEIVKNTPKGEKFDTSEIKHSFLTYMPKELIAKYEEELKDHPIF